MIKNIETPAYECTDCDEQIKDKEKEVERRDSLPDGDIANTINIQTNQESNESIASQPLTSSLELKTQRSTDASSSSGIIAAPADSTTAVISSSKEQQQQDITNAPVEYNYAADANQSGNDSSKDLTDSPIITATTEIVTATTVIENSCSVAAATTTSKQYKPPSPSDSPKRKNSTGLKGKLTKASSFTKIAYSTQSSCSAGSTRGDEDTISKSSDTSGELVRGTLPPDSSAAEKPKNSSRLSERAKKKSWYNVLYPNYKSRSQDFKKLFKEVPNDERLIVDYSCALQRDILVQGRLYVSQNYVCFHANIFRWETYLSIKWKDVTSITKEKTALVIPNAISICTAKEKYFFATFTTRDKAFLMLFRVWQNTLMNKQMLPQEMWQWVHNCYGDELGLTTDDEDYIDPTSVPIETETDLEFNSALEDSISQGGNTAISDYSTANSNSNLSINQIGAIGNNNSNSNTSNTNYNTVNAQHSSGGNSSGGGGSGSAKTKTKSNFLNTIQNSFTVAAAGLTEKLSDNIGDTDCNNKSDMKPHAKELTLISAKPDGDPVTMTTTHSVNGGGSSEGKEVKNASSNYDTKRKVAKNSRQRDESLSKKTEPLPTDMSDSSDSEENTLPFVATAECTSPHEGRQLVHTILPINIDTLFNMLFSKSKFLVDFHAMRKSTDTVFGEWITNEEGQKIRTVNLTVQLAASVGPKNSKVTEHQVMRECSKPGELYSIDVNNVNAGIPYADSFSVQLHYCLVRTIDDHTMLSVHAQIKYKKSIWGVVKGFIEKNTWAGLEDFFVALLHALQSETCIPPAKGKGRRPRRGTGTQIRPTEEAPLVPCKLEPPENVLATHAYTTPGLTVTRPEVPIGNATKGKYKWLSLFVILLLCFLIGLNVILLFKLWKLEERIDDDMSSRARMPNLASLKQLPDTHQEWIDLLRQQEILHETELKKWHKVLQTAIELLKKTEKTLAELMFR